jgi:hypothetical protein
MKIGKVKKFHKVVPFVSCRAGRCAVCRRARLHDLIRVLYTSRIRFSSLLAESDKDWKMR